MLEQYGLTLALVCAVIAILYGIFSARWISAQPAGNERMQQIAGAIQEGARAYLNRQYSTIAIAGVVLFLVIGFALNWQTAIGFLITVVSIRLLPGVRDAVGWRYAFLFFAVGPALGIVAMARVRSILRG